MKKLFKPLFIGTVLLSVVFVLASWTLGRSNICSEQWVAPASANSMVNPLKGDEDSLKRGKNKYKQMCAICHGDLGKGDGVAGASLNPRPANFSNDLVQKQTDGAIFWKLSEGRAPMAAYKEFLSETERWELVNYIRTFKK